MFDDKIAELNRQTELHPPTFEKRTYMVSEIRIFSVSEEMPLMPLSKRGILVRFASEDNSDFKKKF